MNDLIARIEEIRVKAQRRREQGLLPLSEPNPTPPAKVVKLPSWPDTVRAVPNGMLRSALFGAIRRGSRRYMERERIAALEGIEIFYTGQRLDQGDLDVWETILHFARFQDLGSECRVTAYQILKALGKTDSGKNREILDLRLSRMKATGVDMQIGRYGYEGSLINEIYRDKETMEYVFRLNPKLHVLFEPNQFTQIEWAVRHTLDGQPLAQWLHSFYASHAKPYPVKIETLRQLCGSETGELWKFAQTLRKALNAVVDASKAHSQLFSYEIQGDLVHVEKKASGPQQRHLAKKAAKPRKPRT